MIDPRLNDIRSKLGAQQIIAAVAPAPKAGTPSESAYPAQSTRRQIDEQWQSLSLSLVAPSKPQKPALTWSTDIHRKCRPLVPPPWQTKDDRVRGGSSQSYLSPLEGNCAAFYGNLDIKTLGGAGFASQFSPENVDRKDDQARMLGDNGDPNDVKAWDLSAYAGIEIAFAQGDDKVYTFILRDDEIVEKREDGREQAGINWEVELQAPVGGGTVWKPWKDFKATYRGKEKKDVGSLRIEHVRRMGIMMRR